MPSYSSPGIIANSAANSDAQIDNELGGTAEIDGISYVFDVREDLEAEEQLIITLPDYGVVGLGDLFYNGWQAVMTPTFDDWIAVLEEFQGLGVNLYLSGHGPAGNADDIGLAIDYLEVARDAFATATTGEEFTAIMLEAYPDLPGAFLLSIGVDSRLYPTE